MTRSDFERIAPTLIARATAVARRLLTQGETAADVASETMLRLWSMHGNIRDDVHAGKLAVVVARRLSIDALRRQRRTCTLLTDVAVETLAVEVADGSPADLVEARELEAWLDRAMAALPPRELQVLRMRQGEGMTNDEIARLLGLKPSAVPPMLSAARRRLFEQISSSLKNG